MASDIHSLTSVKPMRHITNWWWGCELSGLLIQTRLSGNSLEVTLNEIATSPQFVRVATTHWQRRAVLLEVKRGSRASFNKGSWSSRCVCRADALKSSKSTFGLHSFDPSSFGYSRWHFDLLSPHAGASLQTDHPCRSGQTPIGEKNQKTTQNVQFESWWL